MKEIVISDNSQALVKSKNILQNLETIDNRLAKAEETTQQLMVDLSDSEDSISDVVYGFKGRNWYNGIKKQALLELIQEENEAVSKTVSNISNLITSSNENIKLHSEMISALAMVNAMSFKQLSETATEVESLQEMLSENTDLGAKSSGQINSIIKHQIQTKQNEHNWKQNVELNFSAVQDNVQECAKNLEELKVLINTTRDEYLATKKQVNKITKLLSVKSEENILKKFVTQKKHIRLLFFFSTIQVLGLVFLAIKYLSLS